MCSLLCFSTLPYPSSIILPALVKNLHLAIHDCLEPTMGATILSLLDLGRTRAMLSMKKAKNMAQVYWLCSNGSISTSESQNGRVYLKLVIVTVSDHVADKGA